jgi:hypothetical protein
MKSAFADFIKSRRKDLGKRNRGFMQVVQARKLEVVSQG